MITIEAVIFKINALEIKKKNFITISINNKQIDLLQLPNGTFKPRRLMELI